MAASRMLEALTAIAGRQMPVLRRPPRLRIAKREPEMPLNHRSQPSKSTQGSAACWRGCNPLSAANLGSRAQERA